MAAYRLRDGMELVEIPHEGAMLVDLDKGQMVRLNGTGLVVVQHLLSGGNPITCIKAISQRFRGASTDVEPQIARFIGELEEQSWLTCEVD